MDKKYAEYLLRKTKEDYNLIAEDFSSKRNAPWEELRFLFDEHVIPGDKILDLGCGNGRFYEFVVDKNVDYFGVDFSEKLIEIAKKKYPHPSQFSERKFGRMCAKFQAADGLRLPFPNNYFDKVYSIAVLHHIPSADFRLEFLKEANRILKPNGLFLITVWRLHRPQALLRIWKYMLLRLLGLSKLDFGDLWEPWDNKVQRYYHCFSERELVSLAGRAGFKVKKSGVVKNKKGNRQNLFLVAEKSETSRMSPHSSMDRTRPSGG